MSLHPPVDPIPTLSQLPLVIDTPRLRLRPLADHDVEDMWESASDPEFPKFMSWEAHRDRDETRAFIASQRELLAAGTDIGWAIEHDHRLCGTIGFHGIRWHLRAWRVDRAELGYWVAKAHWGKGFATEAAYAATRWAFETLGLHKVTVGCIEDNIGSRRVIEKVGFRLLGREDEHFWRDGKWWPHLRYELTISEWADTSRTQRFNRPSRPL